jgi:hypothetical protein
MPLQNEFNPNSKIIGLNPKVVLQEIQVQSQANIRRTMVEVSS